MVCQHYGVPTRLMDWTADILMSLYFACDSESERDSDGAIFVCDQNDYPKFAAYNDHAMEAQELSFVSTNVVNPRMRTQSGCFMMWGHAPLADDTKESYDLWQYHETHGNSKYLKKIRVPSGSKSEILKELKRVYSISHDTVYLTDGFLETEFGPRFEKLRDEARLKTLYMTDADRLSDDEEKQARSLFRIDCRNMIGNCESITRIT